MRAPQKRMKWLSQLLMLSLCCELTQCRAATKSSQLQEAFTAQSVSAFFGSNAKINEILDSLPRQAEVSVQPWHGHYWPSSWWGLTRRFFGQKASPIEKFEAAFQATLAQNNPGYTNGELTALEKTRVTGVTTVWAGICDGMSEASLMYPEPKDVVSINGVTFYPFEIKALLGYFAAVSGPGRRWLFAGKVDFATSVQFDETGTRPVDPTYRNVNPGLFHLVLTNFVALRDRGVIADVMPDDMVLNFPIGGFNVTALDEATGDEKTQLAVHNPTAAHIINVTTDVTYSDSHRVLEPLPGRDQRFVMSYHYTLELDETGRIIGGEWQGDSIKSHPNLLWTNAAGNIDTAHLTTLRLKKNLKVGAALMQLLKAPPEPDSAAKIEALRAEADNLGPYGMFTGWAVPPVPDAMVELIKGH